MLFRLLGPLEVSDGDDPLPIGEGRQRAVLILLLLHRNETVSSERLVDALWGETVPPTAAKVLQNYVGQLRRALHDREGRRLRTRDHGYILEVRDDELDVQRFERLADEGGEAFADGQPADAAVRLREALALWRGPALADVAYEEFARPEVVRLEERHAAAIEQRIDADLALGRHADVVAELEGLVARHPLRERLRAQLMVALYRCGRQADALEVYGAARRALIDQLGVEPGPALRDLHAAILRQDPKLAPAPAAWPRPARPPRAVSHCWRPAAPCSLPRPSRRPRCSRAAAARTSGRRSARTWLRRSTSARAGRAPWSAWAHRPRTSQPPGERCG